MNQGEFYRHRDGGIYKFEGVATSSVDGKTKMVAYYHVFPFDPQLWIRPLEEWTPDRFELISQAEAIRVIKHNDAQAYQTMVSANKAKRKGPSVDAQFNYAISAAIK